jgi:type 1 glutamine amidotransferase
MRLAAILISVLLLGACLSSGADPSPARPPPLKVCLLSASAEYKSDQSLGELQKLLEAKYNASCTRIFGADQGDKLPNLEAIDTGDVMVLFARRVTLPPEQLERVRKYCAAGKPIVGIRTASHAFQNWLPFDKEVLGGNYQGHYGVGPTTQVEIVEKAKDHPILAGVKPFASPSSLYQNTGTAGDVELLLTGRIPEHTEPLAWTRMHKGGRIFYTSLGSPADFQDENFVRMLVNAIFWTSRRPVEAKRDAPAKTAQE